MTRGFYFDESGRVLDWESTEPLVLANPEWVRRDEAAARAVILALPHLPGHVWVATSGSSSASGDRFRWIALSRDAFLVSARAVNAHLQASASDVWAHALPIFHVGGLGILARAHAAGSRVVATIAGRWDAARFHARVHESGASLTALVPAQVHDLVTRRLSAPPSLRAVVVGGARLDATTYRAAVDLGWRCLPSYGLTEACSQVATAELLALLPDALPTVLPVLPHAAIAGDAEGRLRIRSSSLLTCTAEWDGNAMQVSDPKVDGWFQTEDLGRVTSDGVEVLGRAAESVKVLGENVSIPRLEEAARAWLASHRPFLGAGIDAAVLAGPHPRLGHELILVLAGADDPRGRPSEEGLLRAFHASASATLLPFERIHRVAWVSRIPRTPLGKVQRVLLAREVGLEAGADR